MKNRIEKKPMIGYKSDVLFKWALTRDDEQTEELRKTIITHITGLPVVKTQVMNSKILPDEMDRFNILVELDDGTYVDLVMQNNRLNERDLAKNEVYLANLHGMQAFYSTPDCFHETHQIVFVNDYSTEPLVMEAHMMMRDRYGHRGGEKIHVHFVYLPYIDDIVKEKGLDGLDKMEAIYYAFQYNDCDFQYNDNHDIIELAKKYQEVTILMEKKDAFNNDLDMYMLAAQRLYAYEDIDEYKEIVAEEAKKKATIEEYKEGFDQGYKKGFNQGFKEGFDQGFKEGFDQGFKKGFESVKNDQLNAERKESINDIGQMILQLSQKMSEDHRQEEFLNALGNPQRLEILFKEYNL